MGAAIQLNRRNRGIKLAGQFDLINGGMPCKTLFVSCAYFRNPKAFGQRSQDISAAVSAVSRKEKKKTYPGWAHTGAGKGESKVGQVYIMQLGSSVMAITRNAVWHILCALNN